MPNPTTLIRALARVARDQQRVIVSLQKLLPAMNGKARATTGGPKRLRCPRCDRKFGLPMNLGRHLAATHKRKGLKKAA